MSSSGAKAAIVPQSCETLRSYFWSNVIVYTLLAWGFIAGVSIWINLLIQHRFLLTEKGNTP